MAVYLEEFIETIENLPHEIRHHLEEVKNRDSNFQELRKAILGAQKSYLNKDWGNEEITKQINEKYNQAKTLADEKVAIVENTIELMNRHIKRLDDQISQAIRNVDEATLSSASYEPQPISISRRRYSRPSYTRKSQTRRKAGSFDDYSDEDDFEDEDEQSGAEAIYCICQQVSFGEMIACDNAESCPYEWFHYECVGLNAPPKGTWYCPICAPKMKKK